MMKNIFSVFLFSMISAITYGQGGNPIMIITCRNAPAAKANSVGFQSKATPDCSTFKGMCPGGFADWEFCVPDPITGELNFTWDPIREICDCELNEVFRFIMQH